MSRYVERNKDEVVVSQEFVGTVLALGVMAGLWGMLVLSIKTTGNAIKNAQAKINESNDAALKNKVAERLKNMDTLTKSLERVSLKLNETENFGGTVNFNIDLLGGSRLNEINAHIGRDIIAPIESLVRKIQKPFETVRKINDQMDESDQMVESELDAEIDKLKKLLVSIFKGKPFKENGLVVETYRDENVQADYTRESKAGSVTLASADEAAKVLIIAGKLIELHVRLLGVPTSNYAQQETYWIWEVQEMIAATARDCINVVARALNETETSARE